MSSQTIIQGFDPDGPFAGFWLPPAFRKRQRETRFRQEWRLTLEQWQAAMSGRPIPPRRKQRGSIILAASGVVPGGFVQMTNQIYNADGFFPGTVISGVSFGSNGTTTEIDSESGNVDETGEWWSDEPITSIGDIFEVQANSAGKTGDGWTTAAAADDTPIALSSSRVWDVRESASVSQTACAANFEIGTDLASGYLDQANVSCNAANDL